MALTASPDAQRVLLDVQALDTTVQQLAHAKPVLEIVFVHQRLHATIQRKQYCH